MNGFAEVGRIPCVAAKNGESAERKGEKTIMRMLIWKNIARRRNQSVLTITITLLTVMAFVMVLGIFQTMQQGLTLSRQRLGADAILIPKYAAASGNDLLFTAIPENIYMPESVLEDAGRLEGIAKMSPQFYAQTLALSCCEPGEEARIIGFDPQTDFILTPYLDEAKREPISDEQVLLGGNFDESYDGVNFMVLGRMFKVHSLLYPTGTGMDSTIFMNMDVVRQLCLESEVLSQDWAEKDPFGLISVIMVKLEPGVNPEDFQKQVEQSGIDAKCILTGSTIASLQSQLEVTMQVLFALWLASMVIAALSLAGRFSALARERKKEIGLLRAIGVKKHQVFGLIIGEACLMAAMGGVAGSAAALICMNPAIEVLTDAFFLSATVWNWKLALGCGGAGVILACLLGFASAFLPAMHSASLDPQTAITQGEMN